MIDQLKSRYLAIPLKKRIALTAFAIAVLAAVIHALVT